MGTNKSLGRLLTVYAVYEIVYTLIVVGLAYFFLNFFILRGYLYPANYADHQLNKVEEKFQSEYWSPKNLPFYYDYRFFKDGELIENTISERYDAHVQEAQATGQASDGALFWTREFKSFSVNQRTLVVSYRLALIPSSSKLYQKIENVEPLFFCVIVIVWASGFLLLIKRSTKLVRSEIQKISTTNDHLQNLDLDFPRQQSSYKEIQQVLESLDSMATDLKQSLQEQWQLQSEQQDLIESVTHDIRTPITLIKGNLELLREENMSQCSERFEDIQGGIDRLELYIGKLKLLTEEPSLNLLPIKQTTLDKWAKVSQTLCRTFQHTLVIENMDASSILVDQEQITTALQNIIMNAIENSPEHSLIFLSCIDNERNYTIQVRDQGSGFTEQNFSTVRQKYETGKTNTDHQHGLGLHIVQKIMDLHQGLLVIENVTDNTSSGAKVSLVFKKSLN